MRKQRNAAFTDEIITEQKEVSADNNNAKTDGASGLKMKRKNSYFSGYGTENLGSCPAPFTCGVRSIDVKEKYIKPSRVFELVDGFGIFYRNRR